MASDANLGADSERDAEVSYEGPAGGWGSLRGVARIFGEEWPSPMAIETLVRQNKPRGFVCVSCGWGRPADPHPFEFCENGAKATLWELTSRRCPPQFFADHTVTELLSWSDFDLEQQGRLTHPLRYDPPTDRYLPCGWEEAFAAIGARLKALPPKTVVFYSSGRTSLEASYLYALFARLYGTNSLPDSSNMCHETTSVALKNTLGSPVGTVVLDDFNTCDAVFFFGQNAGSNSPRILHPLQDLVKRGGLIVTFNPVRERGLEYFTNPQNLIEMLTDRQTRISSQYHQVKTGGDIAAILGLCKHVLAADDDARRDGARRVIDAAFIASHTHGFESFEAKVRATPWEAIEAESGLTRASIESAAEVYVRAERVIGVYGMGLTQHRRAHECIAMLVNLLLLRGMIGRDGAGVSPVRGHSNVQGQRTVGITEKPELVPLDRISRQFGFEPRREKGMNTVEACEGVLKGEVKAFLGLGGNFVRAVPEREAVEKAWRDLELTVHVATKLNRSHLVNGRRAYLLPCLGRTEEDVQASGPQAVTIEDTFSCVSGSIGRRKPASEHLRSEVAIVAGLAKATLAPNPKVPWDEWVADYGRIRDEIAETYPEDFHDFNARIWTPGGFYRGNSARERIWKTASGKAEFTTPQHLSAVGFEPAPGRYRLMTMRSNDQFNTTIYGFSDRLRGIEGARDVLLINSDDIRRAGLREGEIVSLVSDAEDGVERRVDGLKVTPFSLPDGCLAAYYPEMNPLMPLWACDEESKTPAAKSVPVRIVASGSSRVSEG